VQWVQAGTGLGLGGLGQGQAELGLGGQEVLERLSDHSLRRLPDRRSHCSKSKISATTPQPPPL